MALHRRRLTVTIFTDGDADEMALLLAQYLTNDEGPFIGDYRAAHDGDRGWDPETPGREDGWPGPFIRYIQVIAENGKFQAESWSDPALTTDPALNGKVPL